MDNSENLRVRRDYSFFSYLLLCNKSPKNLMTQTNNKYLLSHTYIFVGQELRSSLFVWFWVGLS